MKLTTLFRLRKPDGTDPVNIEDFNDNFDVIDEELGKRLESTGAASDMTVAFEQASTRTNLKTGEKISASFGKIMKWFADLKTVAFSGSYSDLSNKPTIPSGAAADYGVANNDTTNRSDMLATAQVAYQHGQEIDQLNSDLGGCRLVIQDGVPYIQYEDGADTVLKKLCSISQYADITASPTPNSASMTFDLSTIPNHKDLVLWETLFPRMMTHLDMANWNTTMSRAVAFDWSYDASTGALTITSQNPAAVIVQYGTGITDRTVRVYYV